MMFAPVVDCGRIAGYSEVKISFGRVGQLDEPVALQRPLRVREAISSTMTNRRGTV